MLRWRLSSAVFREKLKTLLNKPIIQKSGHRGGLGYWIKVSGVGIPLALCLYQTLRPRMGGLYESGNGQDIVQWLSQALQLLSNRIYGRKVVEEFSMTEYHSVQDINTWLRNTELENKDRLELIQIGTTHQGREIVVAKVSSGRKGSKSTKPALFVEGGIHGREWISSASLLYLVRLLLDNPDTLQDYDLYILPLANPDGYSISRDSRRMWRKNGSKSPNILLRSLGLCQGTDINRNFPACWGKDVTNFSWFAGSRLSCAETFIGGSPASEPETRAIMDFVTKHKDNIMGYISVHSYGNLVMYPDHYSDQAGLIIGKKILKFSSSIHLIN